MRRKGGRERRREEGRGMQEGRVSGCTLGLTISPLVEANNLLYQAHRVSLRDNKVYGALGYSAYPAYPKRDFSISVKYMGWLEKKLQGAKDMMRRAEYHMGVGCTRHSLVCHRSRWPDIPDATVISTCRLGK